MKVHWEKYSECLEGYSSGVNILTDRKATVGKSFTVRARESVVIELSR